MEIEVKTTKFNKNEVVGRLLMLQPSHGDIFYLKFLLTQEHCKGKRSEEELRIVHRDIYNTCKDACNMLGILDDDKEWDRCLLEIEDGVGPKQCQNIFVIIVIGNSPNNITGLFETYHLKLIEDNILSFQNQMHERLTGDECFALSLFTIHQLIKDLANCDDPVEQYMIPSISEEQSNIAKEILQLLESSQEGTNFQKGNINSVIIEESTTNYDTLNTEQKTFCDDALGKILGDANKQFLGSLDAVAGTGKTFTLNVIIAKLLSKRKKVFLADFAGIPGTLLIGGSTFSSQKNAP